MRIRRSSIPIGGLAACRQPCKGEKMSAVERKLTTIVAADVVGFSRLMGEDETGTLEALMACRSIIDQIIEDHHGRIFGSAGDSVVAEFASPVQAVLCAREFQGRIAE